MGLKSYSARLLLGLAVVTMCALLCGSAKASTAFQVDLYSGYTGSGDGTPFTDFVSTSNVDWTYYTETGSLPGSSVVYPVMAPSTINAEDWFPLGASTGFGAVLTGYFTAGLDRNYYFTTYSDDGSKLYIDGVEVVDNGGEHGLEYKYNYVYLTAGIHKVVVNFWENGVGESGVTAYLDPGLIPTNAPTVPIPPAILMLGSGLLGLFSIRRKIK
jgi:hypothetical protein